jgi:hypothetical protein
MTNTVINTMTSVINGTTYCPDTPKEVIRVLEHARLSRTRLRIRLGDTATGVDWLEEWDVEGYIGRSTGPVQIPLLVHNSRSLGGSRLLDHCIIRILRTSDWRVLYSHDRYQTPVLTIQQASDCVEVLHNGAVHARFGSRDKAEQWIKKMTR